MNTVVSHHFLCFFKKLCIIYNSTIVFVFSLKTAFKKFGKLGGVGPTEVNFLNCLDKFFKGKAVKNKIPWLYPAILKLFSFVTKSLYVF